MAGAHDDDEPGFWPGYVAALSGLVQGLLIMAMALGISIYALGQLVQIEERQVENRPSAGLVAENGPGGPALTRRTVPASPPPLTPVTGRASAVSGTRGAMITAPAAGGALLVRFDFIGDAVNLPASSRSAMAEVIDEARRRNANTWRMTLAADLGDPRQRRAGFLRLLALRGALVRTGVPAEQITAGLIDQPGHSGNGAAAELRIYRTGSTASEVRR